MGEFRRCIRCSKVTKNVDHMDYSDFCDDCPKLKTYSHNNKTYKNDKFNNSAT